MLIAIAPHASVIIWSISGQQIAKYNFENEKDLAFDFDAAPGPYIAEVKKYIKLDPDFIAIEPPELIGSGKAISKEKPELIAKAASIVNNSKNKTELLCGAGIVSGEDVSKAIELGSKGILVASGIIKAKNWNKIISEFSKALV